MYGSEIEMPISTPAIQFALKLKHTNTHTSNAVIFVNSLCITFLSIEYDESSACLLCLYFEFISTFFISIFIPPNYSAMQEGKKFDLLLKQKERNKCLNLYSIYCDMNCIMYAMFEYIMLPYSQYIRRNACAMVELHSRTAHTVQMKHRNHFGWCISPLVLSFTRSALYVMSSIRSVCIHLLAFHQNMNAALLHSRLAMLNMVACSIILVQ